MQQKQQSQPLSQLEKYHKYLQSKPDNHTQILVNERLIYLKAVALQGTPLQPQSNLLEQLSAFINKVNMRVMSNTEYSLAQKLNLMGKCIDMLFYNVVKAHVRPLQKLLQLRALTFSNLSCVYKQHRQTNDALNALEVALQIEQTLLQHNHQDTFKSIATTYINKSVILSHLGMHQEAIATVHRSLTAIDHYKQSHQGQTKQIKHMSMFAYFNIAVEHQHLSNWEVAKQFYQHSFLLAKQLGNWDLKHTIINALKKIKMSK